MPTAAIDLPSGKKALVIPINGEALAWSFYENYHKKWKNIAPMKAKNEKWRVPKWLTATEKCHKTNLQLWLKMTN